MLLISIKDNIDVAIFDDGLQDRSINMILNLFVLII